MSPAGKSPSLDPSGRFGENLLRIRHARKLSQENLADRADIHRTQISLLEGGRQQPLLETVVRLAGALDVPVEALFEGIRWVPAGLGSGEFSIEDPPEPPRLSSDRPLARPDAGEGPGKAAAVRRQEGT